MWTMTATERVLGSVHLLLACKGSGAVPLRGPHCKVGTPGADGPCLLSFNTTPSLIRPKNHRLLGEPGSNHLARMRFLEPTQLRGWGGPERGGAFPRGHTAPRRVLNPGPGEGVSHCLDPLLCQTVNSLVLVSALFCWQ